MEVERINPKQVEIVVEFFKIGEIDTMNEKYRAEFNIESKWMDNRCASDQTYDPKIHWNPEIFIENSLNESIEAISYEISKRNDGTIWVIERRNIKGVFWEKLELENFPFDIQELNLIITSKLNSKLVSLVADPNRISHINVLASFTFIDQQKWRLFKFVETRDYHSSSSCSNFNLIKRTLGIENELNETEDFDQLFYQKSSKDRPYLQAKVYCARLAGFYVFNAFLLIFIITGSALTVFSIDAKLSQGRLQTTCTLLLTSVSLKWVTNRYLPTISYLTSLDKYSIVCIIYLGLLNLWHAIVGSNWPKSQAEEIDKWVLVGFSSIFVLFHLIAGLWFLNAYRKILQLSQREAKFLRKLQKSSLGQLV